MQIKYNVTGSQRKALIASMRTILNDLPKYQGAPSFAYTIGRYTIDKNGTVSFTESDEQEVRNLMSELEHDGFQGVLEGEATVTKQEEPEMIEAPAPVAPVDTTIEQPDRLCISVLKQGFTDAALANLRQTVASKAGLIKKALNTADLSIGVDDQSIRFDWFPAPGNADEANAYKLFVTALVNMAKTQKRVTAIERPIDNEKYAFRCFLLRLGFIGDEYKIARKTLLKNLTGNGAFKAQPETESAE